MVACRPVLASRSHGDLKTIAGHVDANENLSCHESSVLLANCLHSPNLAGCGLAVRPRQLFGLSAGPRLGRPSFPTVSRGPKEQRPVPVLSLRPQLILGTSPRYKERAARYERSSDWRRGAAGSPDPYDLKA